MLKGIILGVLTVYALLQFIVLGQKIAGLDKREFVIGSVFLSIVTLLLVIIIGLIWIVL